MKASTEFGKAVKGANVMTPTFVYFKRLPNGVVVELSTGTGVFGKMIWGVTVVYEGKHRTDLGDCFASKKSAEAWISELGSMEVEP